jgi:hypothetical protein
MELVDIPCAMQHWYASHWKGLSMIRKYLAAVAATALVAAPVAAAPANPAASLSVSKSVRTGSASAKKNDLAGGSILAVILAVSIGAFVAVAASQDDSPDSN